MKLYNSFAFLLAASVGTVRASQQCPHGTDSEDVFTFILGAGITTAEHVDLGAICTPDELESIAGLMEAALEETQIESDIGLTSLQPTTFCETDQSDRKLFLKFPPNFPVFRFFVVSGSNQFRFKARCRGCFTDSLLFDQGFRRKLRGDSTNETSRRRTNAEDELCGCHEVNFANAITPTTEGTNEYLTANGIRIVTEDSTNTASVDFARVVLMDSITASDDVVFVVKYVNGDTVTLTSSDPVPLMPITSLAVLDGSIDEIEYCYEACPEAQEVFEANIDSMDSQLAASMKNDLAGANIACLEGIEYEPVINIRTVSIDVTEC